MTRNIFQKWLRSDAGVAFLRENRFLTHDEESEGEKTFWEFLSCRGGGSQAALQVLVQKEDWEGLLRKVRILHAGFVAEQSRDPLYQRIRQVLQGADESYGYQPGRKYSWYGAAGSGAEEAEPFKSLIARGYIPSYPTIEPEAVKKEGGILLLASTFRGQLAAHFGKDYRIPLRCLSDYIRNGYDVGLVYGQEDMAKAGNSRFSSKKGDFVAPSVPQSGEDGEWRHPDKAKAQSRQQTASLLVATDTLRSAMNIQFDEEELAGFAGAVAHLLERENLLLLLCLRMFCELTMAQVARILGYAGASGVDAPLRRAQALIEQACSVHEGLGRDDLDDEMFVRFTGLLLEKCKEEDCSRNSQEKR